VIRVTRRRYTPGVIAAALPAISSDEYRRQARRLRCRYAGRPDRLQRSLKTLATRAVPRQGAREVCDDRLVTLPPQVRPSTGPAATFVEHLAREIPSSGVLTYSSRLSLLRHAQKLGVRRFEANLLIAAVLERRRQTAGAPAESDVPARSGTFVSGVMAFLLVQGAFALVAWWTLLR
jgi:hypothetical protein